MTVNQSKTERIARILAGLALLKSGKKLGLVPLVTGATGYCPAKSKLFGINEVKSGGKCCSKTGCRKDTAKDADKVDEATPA